MVANPSPMSLATIPIIRQMTPLANPAIRPVFMRLLILLPRPLVAYRRRLAVTTLGRDFSGEPRWLLVGEARRLLVGEARRLLVGEAQRVIVGEARRELAGEPQ